MTFLATAARAVRLAQQYTDAWEAALEALEHERPLPEVVRAFAAKTENQLDDRAAETLIEGLTRAIDAAEALARFAAVASPKLAELGARAVGWELRLRSLRGV